MKENKRVKSASNSVILILLGAFDYFEFCGFKIIDKKQYDYLCDKFQQASKKQREKLRQSDEYQQICKYKFIVDNKNTPEMRKAQSKLDKERNALKLEQAQQEYKAIQQRSQYNKKDQQGKQQFIPKCPTCGSTNIRRISTVEKATVVILFGIFSNKRKYQFECQNPGCKYMW